MRPLSLLAALIALPTFAQPMDSPVPDGAEVEQVATGFQFTEGPVWKDGALLFSDIPANTVYAYTDADGATPYLHPSGNSNGLALDAEGRLLLAQHGYRQLARLDAPHVQTTLADTYGEMQINSPNDIAVHSDGSVFFTDPPYGVGQADPQLGFSGIYHLAPDGTLTLLDMALHRPNGIALSLDEQTLYVTNSETRQLFAFDLGGDLTEGYTLTHMRELANLGSETFAGAEGYTDGLKLDIEGRLYVTSPVGVSILAPDGTLIDEIAVPEQTTNCAWGDDDRRTLYITSGTSLYRIRLNATGAPEPGSSAGE
ncbi:MAG: SMP-30/gluconolactonase/LRE family protein [Bacteroidota bacterium]